MRIDKIILKNYRQFNNVEILFNKNGNQDLHVIIGKNGTGKTNILNSINWCLYQDEPHLSKDSQILPVVNLKTIKETNNNQLQKVIIEIWLTTENNQTMVFRRNGLYRLYKDENKVIQQTNNLEIEYTDEDGDTKFLEGDDADSFVDRVLPRRIREFFFFDGERLDKYFKEASSQNIRHAIFDIAQIDLLEKIEKRLKSLSRELESDAGRLNPEIDNIRKELEKYEKMYEDTTIEIDNYNEQIKIAKEKIKELTNLLSGVPDIEDLEKKREILKTKIKEKKDFKKRKAIEKQNLLFENGTKLLVWDCLKNIIQIIKEKKDNKELPPTHDKKLIENTIKNKICALCGQEIKGDFEKVLTNLVNKTNIMSPEIAADLLYMDGILNNFEDRVKKFYKNIKEITEELESYEKEIMQLEKDLDRIEKELSGYDIEKILTWHNERKHFETTLDINNQKLAISMLKKETSRKNKEKLEMKLEDELKKEKKLKELRIYLDFCKKAYEIINKTKQNIMIQTKEEIMLETKKIFFQLLWKKETFKDIIIDDEYNINLIHSMGYECLGSISAAERELLALSFTLALHKISGFNFPILIDTPVARVSDEQRKNFGNVLIDISKDKQVILLFTPSEYSEEISNILDKKAIKYQIKLTTDETETKLEVL